MRWPMFLCGAGLLFICSWIDNMRGPLLPVVTKFLALDYGTAGLIISVGNLVGFVTTWLLMPVLNRWSLKQVGLAVLGYTVAVCLATTLVDTPTRILLWGALIGGCVSTLGSLSNLYVQAGVTPERMGQTMSALHSIYGLSSFIAPVVAGNILRQPAQWPTLFSSVAPFGAALAVFIYFLGPQSVDRKLIKSQAQPISLAPIHLLTVAVMIAYVVSETLTSTWMPSYLMQVHGLTIKDASWYTSMFFAAMLVTRMACGIWARPRWHRILIWGSLVVSLICLTTALLTGWLWLLPFAGVFGPFFPLYSTWSSLRFPERARNMMIWMLSGMQCALSFMHYLMGKLAAVSGFQVAYWLPPAMMVLTLILLKTLEFKEARPSRGAV
jgi:MFS transporter, FHS family, glucose/mannose:H+ symporter